MADDLVADLEALLEGFRDDVFAERLVLHVHHCVMEIRVEGGSGRRVDDGDIDALEALDELRHGHLDALFILSVRGLCLERALKVVIRRQKSGDCAAYRVGVRLLALTLALTLVLSGCGQDSYTTTLSADKVADKLLEVLSGRYHGADADYISESRFGANYRDLTEKCYDHIILLSDDEETNIDQIGVFHVINKSDVSGVADAVTSFVEAEKLRLRDLLTSYNPGELPKLEQAQVKVCGTYVFYSFLSEAETSAAITALEQTLRA